jgi:hypothetical protein
MLKIAETNWIFGKNTEHEDHSNAIHFCPKNLSWIRDSCCWDQPNIVKNEFWRPIASCHASQCTVILAIMPKQHFSKAFRSAPEQRESDFLGTGSVSRWFLQTHERDEKGMTTHSTPPLLITNDSLQVELLNGGIIPFLDTGKEIR